MSDEKIAQPALESRCDPWVDSIYRRTRSRYDWILIGVTALALHFVLVPEFIALLGTMWSEDFGPWPSVPAVEIAALFGTATLIWIVGVHHGALTRFFRGEQAVTALKKMLLALATAGVAIAMSGSNADAAVRAATTCPGFVAHRGETTPPENYTEDGLYAERLGINDPRYVAVEDDAWPTSDGKFLMMHDSTVDATSDGTGPIAGHSLAYWQAHIHLKDGSVPMSLPQYLALFSRYKLGHGYLHVKSSTALNEMARELNAAAVQKYVRVMASTSSRLKTLHSLAPAYLLEYGVSTAIDTDTANQINIAKTYGQKRILLAKPDWTPTDAALKAVFAAGLTVDWTTYGPSQDTVATQWNFARVLTFDVAHLRAQYPTTVCP